MLLLSFAYFFNNNKKKRNTIRASHSLNPDQDRRSVGPDLDANYLQMFSANDKLKSLLASEELKELKMGLLTHLNLMEFPTIIKWTIRFSF